MRMPKESKETGGWGAKPSGSLEGWTNELVPSRKKGGEFIYLSAGFFLSVKTVALCLSAQGTPNPNTLRRMEC